MCTPAKELIRETSLLTCNLSGTVRTEKLGGRDHLVVPMVLLVEGVVPGSKGALYYDAHELSKSASDWNGTPIILNHVYDPQGTPISARTANTLDKLQMGIVLNAEYQPAKNDSPARVIAEGWFDVEATTRVSPTVLSNIQQSVPTELSTGLDHNTLYEDGRTDRGDRYYGRVRDIRPDHLAILLETKGACSLDSGCGLSVNEDPNKELTMTKEKLIDRLVANSRTSWTEDDKKALSSFSEARLKTLNEEAEKEPEVEEPEEELVTPPLSFTDSLGNVHTFDEATGEYKTEPKAEEKKEEETPAPTANTLSLEEWKKTAPPEIREILANSEQLMKEQREALVGKLTKGLTKEQRVPVVNRLNALPFEALKDLAVLAGPDQEETDGARPRYDVVPNSPTANRQNDDWDDTPLPVSTLIWGEDD